MMALTHMAIAATGISFALGDTSPAILGLSVLGSQLPDIDSTTSWMGQICFPISRWIEKRYPHRTLTHSFVASGAIAVLSLPLYFNGGLKIWLALWVAHLITCFSDTFTKQGVQLFFPVPVWCVCGSNPRKRLTTGGPGEYWVLAIAVILLAINLHLTSAGGLLVKTSQTLGLKEGSFRIYNEQAATHQMVATVTGVWASDRRPADGKYFILGADGSEYLVTDTRGKGIYRTGEQLIPSRLVVEAGKPAKTITRSLMFEDESPINTLKALKQAYPNAGIYLSGQLTCDDVENLVTRSEVDRYATLTKSEGGTIKLFYHPLEQAIADLTEQYVAGSLTVKIIRPNPIGARE